MPPAGPLAGVNVLEFSQVIAAPFCGMLLSDMGATVTKVEPLGGEPWRNSGVQLVEGETKSFVSLNRGKRDLSLDLSKPEARAIIAQLIPNTDVVVINYRAGVAERLEIDYPTLRAINPRLIYCQNTGFGLEGPFADQASFDLIAQAMSGLVAGEAKMEDGTPAYIYPGIADYTAARDMAAGICAALYHRERTGVGQNIITSLLASSFSLQAMQTTEIDAFDREPVSRMLEELGAARAARAGFEQQLAIHDQYRPRHLHDLYYRVYQTSDGFIAVGALTVPFRRRLLAATGLNDPRFRADGSFDPLPPNWAVEAPKLMIEAERLFRAKKTAEWEEILRANGIPYGPLHFVEEVSNDPQAKANRLLVHLEHPLLGPIRMAAPPLWMSETPVLPQGPSPALGADNDEVLKSLGYGEAEINLLRSGGVLG